MKTKLIMIIILTGLMTSCAIVDLLDDCPMNQTKINGYTPCAMGTCWSSYPKPCDCDRAEAGACYCEDNKDFILPYTALPNN